MPSNNINMQSTSIFERKQQNKSEKQSLFFIQVKLELIYISPRISLGYSEI